MCAACVAAGSSYLAVGLTGLKGHRWLRRRRRAPTPAPPRSVPEPLGHEGDVGVDRVLVALGHRE